MQFRKIGHLFALTFFILAHPSHATLVVGGFSSERVGIGAVANGVITEELRAAIMMGFPGATFSGSKMLTSSYLDTVDCLIVGSATVQGVTKLSPDEQVNLLNFIKGGGCALIFIDNDQHGGNPTADEAAESFLDPFGIDSSGYLENVQIAAPADYGSPVINGPFGAVETIAGYYSGAFEPLGLGMENVVDILAEYTDGKAALLAIAPGKLAPGSGGVVFFSDADLFVDSSDTGYIGTYDNKKLILNSVAHVIPEPSALSSGLVALGLLLVRMPRSVSLRRM